MRKGVLQLLAASLWAAVQVASAVADEPSGVAPLVHTVHLDHVDAGAGGEPFVELYFRALDRNGDPVDALRVLDLVIVDAGERIDADDVEKPFQEKNAERGTTWVIAFDASKTMRGAPFDGAKAAAQVFFEQVGAHDRIAIITFAQSVKVETAFDRDRTTTANALNEIAVDPEGFKTKLYDALYESIDLIRRETDLPPRSAVIVFSDGDDNGSSHDFEAVIGLAREARVPIYTIGYKLNFGGDLRTFERVSAETGGVFKRAKTGDEMIEFFGQVWRRINRSWIVRYRGDMDGQTHRIELTINQGSDEIRGKFPEIASPKWPWLAGGGGLIVLGAVILLFARTRTAGRLVFVDGPLNGKVFPLRSGKVRIGAIANNDIVIPSMTVSRYHAELRVSGGRVELKDLHSENWTLLNGNRVESAPLQLNPGDRIRFADVDAVYER